MDVMDGITSGISRWKLTAWQTPAKQPIKNADRWQALDAAVDGQAVVWRWVKVHAGDLGNERADELANAGAAAALARAT